MIAGGKGGGAAFFSREIISVKGKKYKQTEKKYIIQATAMIQRDYVWGPGTAPQLVPIAPLPPAPNMSDRVVFPFAKFVGDGANRKFDDSDNIDKGSTRANVVIELIIKLIDNEINSITPNILLEKANESHQIFPDHHTGGNSLKMFMSFFRHIDYAIFSFMASTRISISPGSQFAPVWIYGEAKFSLNGDYNGMKGRASGYPWIQIRAFLLNKAIDNIKLSPKPGSNPFPAIMTTAEYESGYWAE